MTLNSGLLIPKRLKSLLVAPCMTVVWGLQPPQMWRLNFTSPILLLWPPIWPMKLLMPLLELWTDLSTLRVVRPVFLRRGLNNVPMLVDIDVNRPVRDEFIRCIAEAE